MNSQLAKTAATIYERSTNATGSYGDRLNDTNRHRQVPLKKTVGQGFLELINEANFAVKGRAGKKRSTSKKPKRKGNSKKPKRKSSSKNSKRKSRSAGARKASKAKKTANKSSKRKLGPVQDPDDDPDPMYN